MSYVFASLAYNCISATISTWDKPVLELTVAQKHGNSYHDFKCTTQTKQVIWIYKTACAQPLLINKREMELVRMYLYRSYHKGRQNTLCESVNTHSNCSPLSTPDRAMVPDSLQFPNTRHSIFLTYDTAIVQDNGH